jgi:hypothetical protein
MKAKNFLSNKNLGQNMGIIVNLSPAIGTRDKILVTTPIVLEI